MKIKKFDELNQNLITVDDLLDWETREEENVIQDGPIFLSKEQEDEFFEMVKNYKELYKFIINQPGQLSNFDDCVVELHGGMSRKEEKEAEYWREELFQLYADFLNQNGFQKSEFY